MEGWNGEDENSVPAVNVFLCCYSRFLHGVQGELYPKACLVSLQWTKFTLFYKVPWTYILDSFF